MNIIHRRGWEIPDRFITPEHLAFSRRSLLAGAASTLARWRRVQRVPSV